MHDFSSSIQAFIDVGDLVSNWRSDSRFRHIHTRNGFKTEADSQAHQLLFSKLSDLYPSVPILSEESPSFPNERPYSYWLIDPIDGTASWFNGFSGFVCQGAFIVNCEPVFSVIYAPALKKIWYAKLGNGAFLNRRKLAPLVPNSRVLLVDNYPEPRGVASYLAQQIPHLEYLESGSIGLKAAYIADGTADLFVKNVVVRDWDIAPPSLILREVGATLLQLDGSPFGFHGNVNKTCGVICARDHLLASVAIKSLISYADS